MGGKIGDILNPAQMLMGGGGAQGPSALEKQQQTQMKAQQTQQEEEAFAKFKLSQRAQFGASDFGTNLSPARRQSPTLGQ